MATGSARTDDFRTPECRIMYAQGLFEARSVQGSAPKFSCTLVFPNAAKPELEKHVRQVLTERWGEKGLVRARDGLIKSPFLKGDGKEARDKESGEIKQGFGPDVFFIRPIANPDRPPVLRFRDPNIPASKDEIYSGCHGFAVLNCFTWQHPQSGDGISFGIRYFQRTGGGDPLGGGGPVNPDKWFVPPQEEGGGSEGGSADSMFG
jgi:hypothetical protein